MIGPEAAISTPPQTREVSTRVLIVGGSTGGVAAALSCAALGIPCIIAESTDWLGGQLTCQGVPPDENQWIESFGGTRGYQSLREDVRRRVRSHPDIDPARILATSSAQPLNPGGGWVSRLCASPAIWQDAIRDQIAAANGKISVLLNHRAVRAETHADRISSVTLRDTSGGGGEELVIRPELVLDATDTGELFELAGVEHAIGAEHQSVFGELHARTDFEASKRLDALDQQACSWCFALEHRPGEDHTIPRPDNFDWWVQHVPPMSPPWCGPLFSWRVPSHQPPGCRDFRFVPWPDEPSKGEWEMWRYRRIVDRSLFRPDRQADHPDVALINMVQMDYWQKPLLGAAPSELAAALQGAREQSRCFVRWMQTLAPRHDGKGTGYPGLKLRGDELGTADGFAKSVYIREPRRLVARTVVTEAHIGTEQRRADGHATRANNWDASPHGTAHRFTDSVGIGHYMIDLHPSCAGRNNVYVPAAPFRIPMGSLIPVRVRNLLAAGKCLGVTHITNGCYRMHPVEWNAGESAGLLAAWCLGKKLEPAAAHERADLVADFQRLLLLRGVPIAWPWEQGANP